MTSILWLRRDLRLHDHAALAAALAQPGQVQPVFIFDRAILARFTNPDDRRLSFIAAALCGIARTLEARGGGLLVLHEDAAQAMPQLATALKADAIYSAEDYEPATMARDAEVARTFGGRFVQVVDHVLRAPSRIRKEDGTPFKVFTPYYKRWLASLGEMDAAAYQANDAGRYADMAASRSAAQKTGFAAVPTDTPQAMLEAIGYRYHADPLWPADAGADMLEKFAARAMARYPTQRDLLAVEGTSRLGPYLRHGLVSIRACLRAAQAGEGSATWLKELCWREFYMMILYHWPEVATQEFQPLYRGTVPWADAPSLRRALEEARTGYPVVDAALRQLHSEGWMHNRARMIVASFFTKDLLMDWRIGEEHFAQWLMDYEFASNNGGWQWCASTGTDAQPYFRVFNPVLQSRKFDPDGDYIRHYLPELAHLDNKAIHWPHGLLDCPRDYPAPIVEHKQAAARAISAFRDAKGGGLPDELP